MKKLFTCLALAVTLAGFAQDNTAASNGNSNISVYGDFIETKHFGASIEFKLSKETDKTAERSRKIFSIAYSQLDYEVGGESTEGTGFEVNLGNRYYWQEPNKGFYSGGSLAYGSLDFDEQGFKGNYEYFSFINPEIGYKFLIQNKVSIDAFFGYMWKIEVRGGGFIDNKNVDNWTPRLGVKVGYQF